MLCHAVGNTTDTDVCRSLPCLKRKADFDASKRKKAKCDTVAEKYRRTLEVVAEEWICPITQELPLDPVTAEDGRVYERVAIMTWLATRDAMKAVIKSPATNLPMGSRLLPTPQIRNSIMAMVQSGALSGDKAEAWKVRLADEKHVATMRSRADIGDASAAWVLGCYYRLGSRGLDKDSEQAIKWLKRGADLGSAGALSSLGLCYAHGHGVAKHDTRALLYYGMAAASGSESGCYSIGVSFAKGMLGLEKDVGEARKWFEKMHNCGTKDCAEQERDKAAQWLAEHAHA